VLEAHDKKAIIDVIVGLLNSEEDLRNIGENAKKRITQEFTWEAQISKLDKWVL